MPGWDVREILSFNGRHIGYWDPYTLRGWGVDGEEFDYHFELDLLFDKKVRIYDSQGQWIANVSYSLDDGLNIPVTKSDETYSPRKKESNYSGLTEKDYYLLMEYERKNPPQERYSDPVTIKGCLLSFFVFLKNVSLSLLYIGLALFILAIMWILCWLPYIFVFG
jgi:hypothetical protein